MRKSNIAKLIIFAICFSMTFSSYANLKIEKYFNGLDPQKHINKLYSSERKNELKKNQISYDDIEDMIHLYNPEILNNWNSWENNKSSQDIYNDYQEAADALTTNTGSNEMADATLNAQADAMRIQADKNADDSYINFLSNYLTEMKLVLSTKIMDVNYHKSAYDLIIAQQNVEEAKRKLDTAKNAYNAGTGTKLEYLSAEKNLADAESNLIITTSNQKKNLRNLVINCGKSMNDNVELAPVDIFKDVDAQSMNLEADYKKALANNIQFEIYRRRKDNAITTEVKNEYTILIDAAPQNIYNDLESKYSTVLDCIETINNNQVAYKLAVDSLAQAKNNYATGNISKKEYMTAEYNVEVAKAKFESSRYDLKVAAENYNAAVEGLSGC